MTSTVTSFDLPRQRIRIQIEVLVWLVATCVPVALLVTATRSDAALDASIAAGTTSILFGARVFIGHGHARVTATGMFNLCLALVMGYSVITVARDLPHTVNAPYFALAAILSLFAQLGVTACAWGRNQPINSVPKLALAKNAHWLAWVGAVGLVGASIAVLVLGGSFGGYTEAAAFSSITILALGLLWRDGARLLSWSTGVLVGSLALYAEWFHSGSGRLRIVALAGVLAIIYTTRFSRQWIKYFILVLVPAALTWLALDRLEHQEALNVGASEGNSGLESMQAASRTFSQLLEAQHAEGYPLSLGYSLLSFPAIFIPDFIWASKPEAVGYELVSIYKPEAYNTGYSTHASFAGDAVFNFGIWGIFLVIPAVAFLLRFLDRRLEATSSLGEAGVLSVLAYAIWAILAGSLADFAWSGQHIYFARNSMRMVLLFAVVLLAWLHTVASRRRGSITALR